MQSVDFRSFARAVRGNRRTAEAAKLFAAGLFFVGFFSIKSTRKKHPDGTVLQNTRTKNIFIDTNRDTTQLQTCFIVFFAFTFGTVLKHMLGPDTQSSPITLKCAIGQPFQFISSSLSPCGLRLPMFY